MSQVDLGRLLGRQDAAGSAHKIEAGKSGLTLPDLALLAEHFDVSLDLLIRGVARRGNDPVLSPDEIETVLTQFGATDEERQVFATHRSIYSQQRPTAAYIMAFLLGRRSGNTVEQAADAAMLANAREAAIAESGSAERAKPNALRKARKKR